MLQYSGHLKLNQLTHFDINKRQILQERYMKKIGFLILLGFILVVSSSVFAEHVDQGTALIAVHNWLTRYPNALNEQLSSEINNIQTVSDEQDTLFHVFFLKPNGFVVTSADDLIEPIIAFSGNGRFIPSRGNPLYDLLIMDLRGRRSTLNDLQSSKFDSRKISNQKIYSAREKWIELLGNKSSEDSVSDFCVDPLIMSSW